MKKNLLSLVVALFAMVKGAGEKLQLDLLNPLSGLCIDIDTTLLVYQDFEDKMVKAYGVENGQMLGAFLRKGGGQDEVIVE